MFEKLSAPFSPHKVSWRVGSTTKDKKKGMALAYVDARNVMDRLDYVCGPAGWQSEMSDAGDGQLTCRIGVCVDDQWVWKSDGAGGREASKDGRGLSEHDANKGNFSDAFKRAAVQWGIGRYLYDVPAPWVELDEWKKIKPDQQPKLDRALASASANVSDKPKEPTPIERMIAKREVGKRFDSPSDSTRVLNAMLAAMGMANSQSELRHFGETNKREIDHLIDGDWADLMVAIKKRMAELPAGVPMEDAA